MVNPHNGILFLAIKENEVLIHATTWMNLENMPSERSQTQKKSDTKYCMILFIGNFQNRQIHRDRKFISGCLGPGAGGWWWCRWGEMGTGCLWAQGFFLGWWKCPKIVVIVVQPYEYTKTIELCNLYGWIVLSVNYSTVKLIYIQVVSGKRCPQQVVRDGPVTSFKQFLLQFFSVLNFILYHYS